MKTLIRRLSCRARFGPCVHAFLAILVAGLSYGLARPIEAKEISVRRQVLAFYYPWWGTPQVGGAMRHWGAGVTDMPLNGVYDSHDRKVVTDQIRMARQAGITGFIVSWGLSAYEDQAMPVILDAAAAQHFLITVYLEEVKGTSPLQRRNAASADLKHIIDRYGTAPAFLRVGGMPVIFLYGRALNEVPAAEWRDIERQLRNTGPPGALIIGERINPTVSAELDGVHIYSPVPSVAGKTPSQLQRWAGSWYRNGVRSAEGKISTATVIPGFDDRSQRGRPLPRPVTDRYGGKTYRILWRAAIAADPDWILITSWNEWHEGTEIEPSQQYDGAALRDTLPLARSFLALPPRAHDIP